MTVHADFSALKRTRWHEYALRFLFGGAITVVTGILAKRFGPVFGGLFLAFPAIFPASATLVEKHVDEKRRKAGILRTVRGSQAAALDAKGAAQGSIGLACFGLLVWKLAPVWNGASVLFFALIAWFSISLLIWEIRKRIRAKLG